MNFLLDTHAFLWLLVDPKKMSQKALGVIKNPRNDIYVSVVSFWEISIKTSIGKLKIEGFDVSHLPEIAKKADIQILDLSPYEAASNHRLIMQAQHKDPFDRMLIWQAIQRDYPLITKDNSFKAYKNEKLQILW